MRPRLADELQLLADAAAHLLGEREAKYPAMVAAGKMSQADADTGTRTMRAVAEQWRAMVDGTPAPDRCACCGGASYREQRDTLIAASSRTAQIAANAPDDTRKADRAAAVAALLWHAETALAAERACWSVHAQAA
ncbi:hypothetical protein [Sphingomonas sp. PAMC 26605]|uniref:hypothetical protein n=1 Tax=Sphingomonas sp. PAMC 26605 TaxID=1112214 RepID=UPI00026CD682|nr:hypothetical protein [Sphingomonas sp. PAMC 26605]